MTTGNNYWKCPEFLQKVKPNVVGYDAEMETRTIIGKWKRKLNKWAYGLDGK